MASKTDLAGIGNLNTQVSYEHNIKCRADSGVYRRNMLTHLVEVLEEIDYPALDLVLRQTGRRGVKSDGLRDEAGSELRHAGGDGGAANMEGSRGLNSSTGDGGPQGADNGGAEHIELIDREREGCRPKQRARI